MTGPDFLRFAFHYLHVICAAFWIGSMLYTEIILWPRLREINELTRIQTALRDVRMRRIMGIFVVGTIVTGIGRAYVSGAFDRLYSTYGVLLMTGALLGVFMMTWWVNFPPRTLKWGWRMFYASFWVVFALMVGMRFAA